MTSVIRQNPPVPMPSAAGRKPRTVRKKSPEKDFFGLLPSWKIDTQLLKDELRD